MKILIEDISTADASRIGELMRGAEIETYEEMFRDAVSLLKWAVDEAKTGRITGSIDESTGKYRTPEPEIVTLKRVREKAQAEKEKTATTQTEHGIGEY